MRTRAQARLSVRLRWRRLAVRAARLWLLDISGARRLFTGMPTLCPCTRVVCRADIILHCA